MPYKNYAEDRTYLTEKFRTLELDPSTGADQESIESGIETLAQDLEAQGLHRAVVKARLFEYICMNVRLGFSKHDFFPAFGCTDRNRRPVRKMLWKWADEVTAENCAEQWLDAAARNRAGIHTVWRDFDHSVPDWQAVLDLGFTGLRDRAREYRKKREGSSPLTADAAGYFDSLEITANAILNCIDRLIALAQTHPDAAHPRIAAQKNALTHLRNGAPRSLYEALLISYLYFIFGEHFDHIQVRSLGNLDRMLLPYYERDLKNGTLTTEGARELFACYFMQWGSINNYWGHPFYLGGTKADGSTEYNELSYLILDVYDKLDITTPKIQLKIASNTPRKLLDTAFEMVRKRQRALVFVSEENIRRIMMSYGHTAEEARTCDIRGCYEIAARGAGNETGSCHINLLKIVELIFNDGTDPVTGYNVACKTKKLEEIGSFDEFFRVWLDYARSVTASTLDHCDVLEKDLDRINPGGVVSLTVQNSLETALDAFTRGYVYNNTAILLCGLATTVDALMAVKKFVFDRKEVTLAEFKTILASNWKGHELLRLKALRSKEKFGNGLDEVDHYANVIVKNLTRMINGRPNARGGEYRASGHCARQFITMGELTGATPDGRRAGEEFSKNLSPAMGADTNGVTALLKSAGKLDCVDLPGDFPLDIMLHPTTVQGEAGLNVMQSVLFEGFRRNCLSIQFNIMDVEMLRKAQEKPEEYEGLQVRICGWNVRFNDICRKEQDAYIERAMQICE